MPKGRTLYKPITATGIRRVSKLLSDVGVSPSAIAAETGYPLAIVEALAEMHADRLSLRHSFEALKGMIIEIVREVRQLRRVPTGQLDTALLQVQVGLAVAQSPELTELRQSIAGLRQALDEITTMYRQSFHDPSH